MINYSIKIGVLDQEVKDYNLITMQWKSHRPNMI